MRESKQNVTSTWQFACISQLKKDVPLVVESLLVAATHLFRL